MPYNGLFYLLLALSLLSIPLLSLDNRPPLVDLSLMVVDLKCNREQGIKVCEIQPASMSRFKSNGYDNRAGIEIVDHLLELVDRELGEQARYFIGGICDPVFCEKALDHGWQKMSCLAELVHRQGHQPLQPGQLLSNQDHGILYVPASQHGFFSELHRFAPHLLLIDEKTVPALLDKWQVHQLISQHPQLAPLRPKAQLYPTEKAAGLAAQIIKEIPSPLLVIKPTCSTKGQGVVIVSQAQLKPMLELLFGANRKDLSHHNDLSYGYWGLKADSTFLVEEHIASDPFAIPFLKGALFDPTLRVVVGLVRRQGEEMEVVPLGKYWKFPMKHLASLATLNERHKSCGDHPYNGLVDEETWKRVETQLFPLLPLFYEQVAAIHGQPKLRESPWNGKKQACPR